MFGEDSTLTGWFMVRVWSMYCEDVGDGVGDVVGEVSMRVRENHSNLNLIDDASKNNLWNLW